MFERLKELLKKWKERKFDAPRARAAIKREEIITEAPRSRKRGQTKLMAYDVSLDLGPSATGEEIAKETARRMRKLQAEGRLKQQLRETGKRLPQPTKTETAPLWKETLHSTKQILGPPLEWFFNQISRGTYFFTKGFQEMREAQKELGLEDKSWYELARSRDPKLRQAWLEMQRRGAKAGISGFLHPEKVKESESHLVPEEYMPEWVPKKLRKPVEAGLDIGFGMLTDPTAWISLVKAPLVGASQALRNSGRLKEVLEEALSSGAGKGLAVERAAREGEREITRLLGRAKELSSDLKKMDAFVRGLREQAKTSKSFLKKDYAKLRRKLEQELAELHSARGASIRSTVRPLEKEAAELEKSVDSLRRRWLVEGDSSARNALERARARLQELRETVPRRRAEAMQEWEEKRDAILAELRGLERRRAADEAVLGRLTYAEQSLEAAKLLKNALRARAEELSDVVKRLRQGGGYELRIGPARVGLSSAGEAAGRAYYAAASRVPGVRGLINLSRSAFRPAAVELSPEVSAAAAKRAEEAKSIAYDWMRRAGTEASAEAKRLLERLAAKADIPEKAWKQGMIVESMLRGTADRAELLKALPPELREPVERVADEVWSVEREAGEKLLEEAFGPEMAEFFGKEKEDVEEGWRFFLEGYLPHILEKPPKNLKTVVDTLTEKTLPKTAPGARPSFTQERVMDTIEALKAAGYKPVEDVRVLAAAHRAQIEQLVQQKRMTDWLEAQGFIRRGAPAGEGWVKGKSLFPWLRGKWVHPEIAAAVQQAKKLFMYDDKAVKRITKATTAAMNIFRPLVTSMRFTYHVYNMVGNVALAMMAGINPQRLPRLLSRGVRVLVSPKTKKEKELVDLFQRYGLSGQGIHAMSVEAPQTFVKEVERYLEKLGSPIKKVKAVFWPKHGSKIPGLEPMTWLGRATDDAFRMGAFLHFIDRGYSAWEAAQLVKRYFFDYSRLSRFERGVMKNIFPFYAWMRYAIPRAILGPIEHPFYLSTKIRVFEPFAKAAGVDRGELPYWMQGALVVGTDDEGRIIYLPAQPPEQTLMQFVGAAVESGEPLNVLREAVRSVSPLYTAPLALAGVNITGGSAPETTKERVLQAVEQFTPAWEVAGALRLPYGYDRPRVTAPLVEGLGGMFVPVKTYDRPYAEARSVLRAEDALDRLLSRVKKGIDTEKLEVPGTGAVETEMEQLNKAAMANEVLREFAAGKDPTKRKLMLLMGNGDASRVVRAVQERPELFYGSVEDVVARLRTVITPENILKLRIYLGRPVKPYDFIEHYNTLLSGELAAEPPEVRQLRRAAEMLRRMREAEETGGVLEEPSRGTSQSARPGRRLSDSDLDNVIAEATRITRVPESWKPYLRWIAKAENAGLDPYAENPTAVNGEHATGLMQTLPSTFRAYAVSGMEDIYNPVHNMVAAIRYIKARYGHPSRIPGIGKKPWKGY